MLRHPFIEGLTDGSLPEACFRFYVIQDSHYLREYARVLSLTAAKAPEDAWTSVFNGHAAEALEIERQLHDSFFNELGLEPGEVRRTPMAPTNLSYTSYLLAVAYGRPFAEILAAVLPCYWIYAEVGRTLLAKGSPHPLYRRWIETYAGEDYAAVVETVLASADKVAEDETDAAREAMAFHFLTSARYEWMFWEMAHKREVWPI